MHIHITEHKSSGTLRPAVIKNAVRVFVDRDYHYGYFVDEHQLFDMLTDEQKAAYLAADNGIALDVPPQVAQALIDIGTTPYAKRRVA